MKRRVFVLLAATLVAGAVAMPAAAVSPPSGELVHGQAVVEPAYDYNTGKPVYLLTPMRAPFPSKANAHAVAPLYLVLYPAGSSVGTLDCMGVPGNCPDHDGEVAGAATAIMPSVYGSNLATVIGHDHLVGAANSGGDFNVAWRVFLVLFTNSKAANTHITTLAQLTAALDSGNAISVDSGIVFNCSIVSAAAYRGRPL